MAKNPLLFLIAILICGCSSPKKDIISDHPDADPVITGSVQNLSALQKGGTLVLGIFRPGPGAAADDETDQLSSMVIKGIKDALPGENTPFVISDQQDAQFYLEGYIEDYGSDRHFSHLKLRHNQVHFSLDGEIWLRETGEKILSFEASEVIDTKTHDPKNEAYRTGTAIARFIGSQRKN